MPKKPSRQIACEFFNWNLFERDAVLYADGRCNVPSTGKHLLGTRSYADAIVNLGALDLKIAIDRELTVAKPLGAKVMISITDGWQTYKNYCSRPAAIGGVGKKTLARYRAVSDKHVRFCHDRQIMSWDRIDNKSLELYGGWLEKEGYSTATIYLECILLKQVVKWLIEEEKMLPESSRIRLTLVRSHESDTHSYSQPEVTAMLDQCRKSMLQPLQSIITTLATTGMRIGELIQLRWSDVDLSGGIITLRDNRHSGRQRAVGPARTTKGRRGRRIPIHNSLRVVLDRMERHSSGLVFVGPRGGALKADDIRLALIKDILQPLKEKFPTAKGEIGFEHGRLHNFRHYFVSQAFLDDASEGEVREWVGHRDSRIVERYRHLGSDEARRKMDRIQFIVSGSTGLSDHGSSARRESEL